MARTKASIKKDPQFRALLSVLKDEELALERFARLQPAAPVVDEAAKAVQELLDAGFTAEEAEQLLADDAPKEEAPKAPVTSKERAEALVEDKGYSYTKGRVYGGKTLAEAMARVLRSGKPEIVQSSGVGRTAGVLVYREESGDVALQNLTKSA